MRLARVSLHASSPIGVVVRYVWARIHLHALVSSGAYFEVFGAADSRYQATVRRMAS